ncbi:PEP-CTERM sorting domain-containing protein [uncultured Sulfitobacter sp.]|uniref:PEP-CTERM sorting domain-containing protein n=1 Tax=uncultured Sulfitobacter sp. TaxID=191468 RepID=UPI002618CAF7|nr:PEP-CTERM sorting domain-containing protein [uncultured Sulfitobacter sp.]
MTRFQTLLTSALLSLTLTPSAQATTLVDQGIAMRDFATNLLWLDLDQTNGLSPNAALSAFPNFRMATHGEVVTLFLNAGFDGQFEVPNTTTNFDAASLLTDLLGTTASFTVGGVPKTVGQGWADDGNVFREPFYEINYPSGQAPTGRFFGGNAFSNSGTQAINGVGTFLVSQVPLPTTLPLLLSALALIGLQMRGKKRRAAPA